MDAGDWSVLYADRDGADSEKPPCDSNLTPAARLQVRVSELPNGCGGVGEAIPSSVRIARLKCYREPSFGLPMRGSLERRIRLLSLGRGSRARVLAQCSHD